MNRIEHFFVVIAILGEKIMTQIVPIILAIIAIICWAVEGFNKNMWHFPFIGIMCIVLVHTIRHENRKELRD